MENDFLKCVGTLCWSFTR